MSELLEIENLSVRFPVHKKRTAFRDKSYLTAVDSINFNVKAGETLAIVGESGSGKTTAALAIARLTSGLTSGTVRLNGTDILDQDEKGLREMRRKIQVIFQDPYSSLNPRQRAEDIVREPLDNLTNESRAAKDRIVDELFAAVGLRPEQKHLFPHQFSGGQRQRIGIARALSTRPKLIICDEPVSALDVAVQAQILNLLRQLQTEFSLTYLFISHDLGVVQHMCDRVAVMYMGKVVEYSDRMTLFKNPRHPYTKALLSAVPSVSAKRQSKESRILISGDPPDPLNMPLGCRFASRCSKVSTKCHESEPELSRKSDGGRVACHFINV